MPDQPRRSSLTIDPQQGSLPIQDTDPSGSTIWGTVERGAQAIGGDISDLAKAIYSAGPGTLERVWTGQLPPGAPETTEAARQTALTYGFGAAPEGSLATGVGRLYHGTPHTFAPEEGAPFGRFQLEAVGTGEGAQMEGHGLYFAERKGIAGHYQDVLSTGRKRPGRLYEANITAEKEHFLDLDRPFDQQDPHVQQALQKLGIKSEDQPRLLKPTGRDIYKKLVENLMAQGQTRDAARAEISRQLNEADIPGARYVDAASRGGPSPAHIQSQINLYREQIELGKRSLARYQALKNAAGATPEQIAKNDKFINDYQGYLMRRENSIKQLEQQLKHASEATYNYVVYNPKIIDIVSRDGQPLPAPVREEIAKVAAMETDPQRFMARVQEILIRYGPAVAAAGVAATGLSGAARGEISP